MIDTPADPDNWSLAKPSARRSLILCALGAIIGLLIAGFGLFTAKGTRTYSVPVEDVALVNQVPILMSDYVQQLQALYAVPLSAATPAQKRETLDGMIREELYVQRGVELGLQSDTIEVREALVGAVEAQSAADATMAQPTEAELRAYYRTHVQDFQTIGVMKLADYRVSSQATAEQIAQTKEALGRLAGSEPPNVGIAHRSALMNDGEEFYFAARIHLGQDLFAAAHTLRLGEVSAPMRRQDGIHLMVMEENTPPVPIAYADVRDKVLTSYIAAQTSVLTGANDRFLRKRADIQIAKGFG